MGGKPGLWSVKVLRRRWYACAAGLLVTMGTVAFVATQVRTAYQASGTLVLLQPEGGAETGTNSNNPYTSFDASLQVTADTLATVLGDKRLADRLRADGATGSFEVKRPSRTPFIVVNARGRSGIEAVATIRKVMQTASLELARRQQAAGAPSSTWIRVDVLGLPAEAVPVTGRKTRVAAAVILLGFVLSIGFAFLLEALSIAGTPGAPKGVRVLAGGSAGS